MEEHHIEMTWRCSTCQVQNLGRHTACTGCGHPKDDSEAYEMPDDAAAAPAVVDPALLRLAEAGENWRCRYCTSHQRRLDGACGSCGAAQDEGSAAGDGTDAPDRADLATDPGASRRQRARPILFGLAGIFALLVACAAIVGLRGPGPPPPLRRSLESHVRVVDAPIAGRTWEHRVYVDRWRKVAHQGFAELRPPDAVDIVPLGPRQHHTERVLAGYRTDTYSERVSDGSTTETYTASESCGQTCTSRPQSCRQVCSSSKNGFAKCREECSGGGQTCTTKTCSVTKTRSVPRYKDVSRTRQVPQYRDEPRFAPFFGWKLWQWVENRRLARAGTVESPAWPPPEELAAKEKLDEGERERDRRETSYAITVNLPDHPGASIQVEALSDWDRASKATSMPVYLTPAGESGVLGLP